MDLKVLREAIKETSKEFLIMAYVLGILVVISLFVFLVLSGAYWVIITAGSYLGIAAVTIDKVVAYTITGGFLLWAFYMIFISPFVHNYNRIKNRNERYEG